MSVHIDLPVIRIMKIEPVYTLDHPNPEWETKCKLWLDYALSNPIDNKIHPVAYIPNLPMNITHASHSDNIVPKKYDLDIYPDSYNFYMDGHYNSFVLIGNYHKGRGIIGSGKTAIFFPDRDNDIEVICKLLMLSEKIYVY